MAPGQFGRYRLLEMLAYIATEIHKAFHPLFDPMASEAEKKKAGETVARKLSVRRQQAQGPVLVRGKRYRRRLLSVRDVDVGGEEQDRHSAAAESLQRAHKDAADGAGGAAARGAHQVNSG